MTQRDHGVQPELAPGSSDEVVLPLLRRAFVESLRQAVESATRKALDAAADPFAVMVAISRSRERDFFGAGFEFSHPEDDQDRYTSRVTRCYYHQVLCANGAAHLTPISPFQFRRVVRKAAARSARSAQGLPSPGSPQESGRP